MDLVEVGLAVKRGVSIVCATCKHYWDGRARGLPDPKCTTVRPCGSPFAKLAFPEYSGPITDFSRWCFVCGGRATKGVKVREEPRVIGMCDEHVQWLGKIEPVGLKLNGESLADVIDRELGRVSIEKFLGPETKTLGQVISAAESELAKEGNR